MVLTNERKSYLTFRPLLCFFPLFNSKKDKAGIQVTMSQNDPNIKEWIPTPSTRYYEQPNIVSYGPSEGHPSDQFYINLHTSIHPELLKIAFDHCILNNNHFTINTVTHMVTVHASVPSTLVYSTADLSRIPVYLVVQDNTNYSVLDSWYICDFCYSSRKRLSNQMSSLDTKRQRSEETFNIMPDYYINPTPFVGLSPPSFSRPFSEQNYPSGLPSGLPSTSYIMPNLIETAPSQTSPESAPGTAQQTNIQPLAPSLSQPQSSQQASSSSVSPPSENIFSHLVNKADLRIEGNLESMMENWNTNEKESQRRLVEFWRKQQDNNVICRFEPLILLGEVNVRQELKNRIVVSCIYWKSKNDYYITSVDCIYLLENLIGVGFTVEEKNRVRRNLEGFKPQTVSKLKPDSADFFKLIMGFPHPKPRNIEKDLKVFPWSILATALKKIISKYTASYSSTA
ncbi:hypothetical protein K501DRAFT_210559, partial [Backusella circina FSU 941]